MALILIVHVNVALIVGLVLLAIFVGFYIIVEALLQGLSMPSAIKGNAAVYKDLNLLLIDSFCHELTIKKSFEHSMCTIANELYTVDILSFISAGRAKRGQTSQHQEVRSKPTYS